jgi:hypothetical protein
MSRGLGELQRSIKDFLIRAQEYNAGGKPVVVTFADIRVMTLAGHCGADYAKYKMLPTFERSLKRALKTLVDRGEVVVVKGKGRAGDPYLYCITEIWKAHHKRHHATQSNKS